MNSLEKIILEANNGDYCRACEPCKNPPCERIKDLSEMILDFVRTRITETIIQVIYEEMHPIKDYTSTEEMNNRKEKAIDEYLGRNQEVYFIPILHTKVDKIMWNIREDITKKEE